MTKHFQNWYGNCKSIDPRNSMNPKQNRTNPHLINKFLKTSGK